MTTTDTATPFDALPSSTRWRYLDTAHRNGLSGAAAEAAAERIYLDEIIQGERMMLTEEQHETEQQRYRDLARRIVRG